MPWACVERDVAAPPLGDPLFFGESSPNGVARGADLGVHDDPISSGHDVVIGTANPTRVGRWERPPPIEFVSQFLLVGAVPLMRLAVHV